LLGDDLDDLVRYEVAQESALDSLAHLRSLVEDDPEQAARVRELAPLVHSALGDFEAGVGLQRTGRHDDALREVHSGTAAARMAKIRTHLLEIEDGETALLNQRRDQAAASERLLLARATAAVGATAASLAGISALLAYERRRIGLSETHFRRI